MLLSRPIPRAHFRPTSKTTNKIASLKADQKPLGISIALPLGTPQLANRKEISNIEFSQSPKTLCLLKTCTNNLTSSIGVNSYFSCVISGRFNCLDEEVFCPGQ